jgi:hypothetical protein
MLYWCGFAALLPVRPATGFFILGDRQARWSFLAFGLFHEANFTILPDFAGAMAKNFLASAGDASPL